MAKKTTAIKWVFVLLAICVLLVVLLLTPANKHQTQIDYLAEYNRISKPANFDPNDNAAPYFDKAFEVMAEEPNDFKDFRKFWPADMNEDQQQTVKQWAASNAEALKYLKEGISKKYYWKPLEADSNELVMADMNDLSKFRKATFLLCLDAKMMAQEGRIEAACRQLADVYKMGIFLSGPRFIVYQLVGMAISTVSIQSVFQIFDHINLPPSILKEFQQRITLLSSDKTFVMDFTAEKLILYDEIQHKFLGSRKLNISENTLFSPRDPLLNLKYMFLNTIIGKPWLAKEKHKAEMMYDYFDSVKFKTPWQLHSEEIDIETMANKVVKGSLTLGILTPAFSRILSISYRAPVYTDALIATTAALRYKADKGSYPQDLQELVASGYLDKLPMDPFGGGPLTYKLSGDSVILYSFAQDFDDDGGKHDSNWADEGDGDYVFWPVPKIDKVDRTKTQN